MWSLFRRKARPAAAPVRRPGPLPRLEALEVRFLLTSGALDTTFNALGSQPGTALGGAHTTANVVLVQPGSGKIVLAGTGVNSKGNEVFATTCFNPNGTLDSTFGSGGTVLTTFKGSSGNSFCQAAALYPTSSGDDKIVEVGGGKSNSQNAIAVVRYNANGTLDSTFGSGGVVLTTFSQQTSQAAGVIVDSQGRIVVATTDANATGFELARYNANGSLDTTFGSGGKVYTSIGSGTSQQALALDPVSGDLIVVGEGNGYDINQSYWLIAAYKQTGALDTSFGTGGIVTNASFTEATSVAVQPDGRFVVAGWGAGPGNYSTSPQTFDLARYNANGTLDSSFGTGGMVTTAINPTGTSEAFGVAVQGNGKIVATGTWWDNSTGASQRFALTRYNADGTLDSSFGSGGIVTTLIGSQSVSYALALQANGEIVAAGYSGSSMAVARYQVSSPVINSFSATPSSVTAGSSLTLTASNITDDNPNATITGVTFYYYDSKGSQITLGSGTQTSPGVWTLTNSSAFGLTAGTYKIYAQATDSAGVTGDPASLSLTVK